MMVMVKVSLRRRLPAAIVSPPFYNRSRYLSSSLVHSVESHECDRIAQELQTNGFGITSSSVLSGTAIDAIRLKMPDLFRGEFETGVYPDEWHWRQGLSRDDVTREMCNTWKCDRLIASVILSQTIGSMVSRITNWPTVRIAQDDLIWKPPGQSKTTIGYHQDGTYISNQFVPRENNSITVWIALDDVTKEMGCVEYAVGSHLWEDEGNALDDSAFHGSNAFRDSLPQQEDCEIHGTELSKGHVIVHHQNVWHGSGPNLSLTKDRRALVGHYIRGDVEFEDVKGDAPWGATSYIYGKYKRYGSTEVDENFFPIVFATEDSGAQRTPWLDDYVSFP